MKKIYQQPEMKAIRIQSEHHIAMSGYPKIGGNEEEDDNDLLPSGKNWD